MSVANEYVLGQVVRVKDTITVDDVLTDPQTVTVTFLKPDGSITRVAASQDSAGKYSATITTDVPGLWWYAFDGVGGPGRGSGEKYFLVKRRKAPAS